jgi:glyoxylase-like metal-dependent hydrolase (beta-lactamase superfamily II)
MARLIDCMHLGHDRVIGAWEPAPGVLVDPGPTTCIDALLGSATGEPRALLLTHIHLDHAGATGVLARRFPDLLVHVHEDAAGHVADPERLVSSAARLYGAAMGELWGEVAPVPEERIVALRDGDTAEGLAVIHAPGHASHHVAYHDRESGEVFTGDVAGVRIPPSDLVMAPTPPPQIDVEAWFESIRRLRRLRPSRLCMTHFGAPDDPEAHLGALESYLRQASEISSGGDRDEFARWLGALIDPQGEEVAARLRQAMPPDQLWLGLERYWQKRRERESS